MPIYQYRCTNENCEQIYEVFQPMSECLDLGDIADESCDICETVGLVRVMSSGVKFAMVTPKRPSHVTSTGTSALGPDDERAVSTGHKISEKVRRGIYRERYAYRNAQLEKLCNNEELVRTGKVQPKILKKMFDSGAIQKTVSMTAMEKPHHKNHG